MRIYVAVKFMCSTCHFGVNKDRKLWEKDYVEDEFTDLNAALKHLANNPDHVITLYGEDD